MYYIEMLRTWHVFQRYLIVLVGIVFFVATLMAIFPHPASSSAGISYSAGGHAVGVAFICLLFASIAGLSLSRHLDHLDFALTKPRARTAFVASTFGIDVLGLIAFFTVTTLAFWALHIAASETHAIVFDANSLFGIVLAFGSMLAWYAIVQAVSCTRDSAGWAVAGIWIAALGLQLLGAVRLVPGLHGLIVLLNFINPIAYLSSVPFEAQAGAASLSIAAQAFAIYIVAGAAALVALIRWQRVEI